MSEVIIKTLLFFLVYVWFQTTTFLDAKYAAQVRKDCK